MEAFQPTSQWLISFMYITPPSLPLTQNHSHITRNHSSSPPHSPSLQITPRHSSWTHLQSRPLQPGTCAMFTGHHKWEHRLVKHFGSVVHSTPPFTPPHPIPHTLHLTSTYSLVAIITTHHSTSLLITSPHSTTDLPAVRALIPGKAAALASSLRDGGSCAHPCPAAVALAVVRWQRKEPACG